MLSWSWFGIFLKLCSALNFALLLLCISNKISHHLTPTSGNRTAAGTLQLPMAGSQSFHAHHRSVRNNQFPRFLFMLVSSFTSIDCDAVLDSLAILLSLKKIKFTTEMTSFRKALICTPREQVDIRGCGNRLLAVPI